MLLKDKRILITGGAGFIGSHLCQALAENLSGQTNGVSLGLQDYQPESTGLRPAVSVVIPVLDEEENLPLLYHRLTEVLDEAEPSYELIFVDDGSRDSSGEILMDFCERDKRVVIFSNLSAPRSKPQIFWYNAQTASSKRPFWRWRYISGSGVFIRLTQ